MRTLGLFLAVCLTLTPGSARADLIELDALHQGRFREDGLSGIAQQATTGWTRSAPNFFRAFITFDLSRFAGQIESAVLSLQVSAFADFGGQETIDLFDFTSAPTLVPAAYSGGSPTGTMYFDDLGTGEHYGEATFVEGIGNVVEIELNSAAITDLNAATGGHFVLGISLRDPMMDRHYNDYVRFGDTPENNHLMLTYTPLPPAPAPEAGGGVATPEPATLVIWLLLIVPACIWGLRKRARLAG